MIRRPWCWPNFKAALGDCFVQAPGIEPIILTFNLEEFFF